MRIRPRRLIRRASRAIRYQIHAYWRSKDVAPGTVLYESFGGNGMLCNPEAIFRALLRTPDMMHLTHIWAISTPGAYRQTIAEFSRAKNVRFVRRGSPAYYRALATSQYLVNNATFPPEFSKRAGQTYLNTWHGTPLKQMGFDMPDGPHQAANTLRNFVSADYLLSANPFMTETMYRNAYKLGGVFRGAVIEEGYPRIDRQFLDDDDAEAARHRLEAAGITLGGRRIIVYAPTWRGSSFGRPEENLDEILAARQRLKEGLDTTKWRVLLKLHQVAHAQAAHRPETREILIPNAVPTNVVLGVTDILVTDYSSIFFDFLPTGRPIVFYAPDQDEYADARGLYPIPLPAPIFTNLQAAATQLAALCTRPASSGEPAADDFVAYREAQAEFCPWEDGHASERVIDIVFRGAREGHRIRKLSGDHRVSILFYMGGMRPNGITSSAFNLVNSIDHGRFDISIAYTDGRTARRTLTQRSIDPAIRHFPRVGGMNGSKVLHLKRRLALRRGQALIDRTDLDQHRLWDDEWTRCFGESRFDHVIDFSGYGPIWATLLLHSPAAIRSIWLHNDMASDARRVIHGKLVHFRSLNAVFAHYSQYDHLVSVSSALADINRRELADWAKDDKFDAAPNCIDGPGILSRGSERIFTLDEDGEETVDPLPGQLRPHGNERVFVCVGRLSTEKNHERLINAFATVRESHPEVRLVIVGSGPLSSSLHKQVTRLGLTDAVLLVGQRSNPFAIMARSDCFVLSSNYEGQPMVLLEAAVLGLPIVTVDFPSAADALPEGTAMIVPQTTEALAAGMTAYLDGRVAPADFDYAAYNREAINAFYRVLGTRAAVVD